MKKKTYEKPQTEILEVKTTEIICTSTQTSAFKLGVDGEDLEYEEEDW